jgi:hypothetical protein
VLLVLGALAFTLGDLLRRLVEPAGTPDAVAVTQAVDQHSGAWLTAGLLSVAAAMCLVPGVLALIPRAVSRGSRITTAGVGMVFIGAMASVGHAVAFYSPYALYAKAGTAAPELTAIDDASEAYPLLVVLIVLFIVGMMLGSIVLFLGLRRARRVPIWSVVAVVVFVGCGSTGGIIPGVVGVVAGLAAFVPAARSLLVEVAADDRDPEQFAQTSLV